MTIHSPETTDPDLEAVSGEAAGWAAGQAFDGYRLIRPLGQGGMGTVWLGEDTLLERPVALKFLSTADPDPQGSPLLAEARALARVVHPNVAAVYRVGVVEGRLYIAYEYLDGLTLAQATRPMGWREALTLGIGLAWGIAAAHRHGVLHRDIKPANVVLTGRGEPKLIDFGLAQVREPVGSGVVTNAPRIPEGALAGTPLYMAPERWRGGPASEAADLYGLGLVLYELLVGSLPHGALAGDRLLAHLLTREVPRIERADLPPPLVDLVARLTASEPGQRYATAEAVGDALEVVRALYRCFTSQTPGEDDDQALLVGSLQRLRDRGAALGRHFYAGLFADHPELRPLFPLAMAAQEQKLEMSIELVVRRLGSQEELVPLLEDLGRRHGEYGATPAHFHAVGAQLLRSLAALSGDAWSAGLQRAWAHAYDRIAYVMVRGLQQTQLGFDSTQDLIPPTQWELPVGPPQTLYARSGGLSIAYQVIGAAPVDVVVIPGLISHLEVAWELPGFASAIRRLSSFVRVIMIDRRGTGLSDRAVEALALDEQVADIEAVLDEVGVERAVILGLSAGSGLAAAFAALRPERARALIVDAMTPCASDDTLGIGAARHEAMIAELRAGWGGPLLVDAFAPSRAGDPEFCGWWARILRTGASLGAAEALWRSYAEVDLRAILRALRAPTLLLHRRGDALAPVAGARAAAEMIVGSRLIELEGEDHLAFVGDSVGWVAAIHEFLGDVTEAPAAAPTEAPRRVVAVVAVVATDPADPEAASATPLRTFLQRAIAARRPLAYDLEAGWAAMLSVSTALECAEQAVSTLGLLGLEVAAAVCAGIVATGEQSEQAEAPLRERAQALATATPPGTIAIDALSRELVRGGQIPRQRPELLRFDAAVA